MNVPMTWLRELTGVTDGVRAFMEKMTNAGAKVEGLSTPGAEIDKVVVGRITSIEKHPNADKLVITRADVGEKELQIVTGAQNLHVGDYIPVALDGASLAKGLRIKKGKLRGEVSDGMLCSIDELGYTRHDYPEAPEDGIYVLPDAHPLGADAVPIMEIRDEVIDFEVLSNRPDMNSVMGIAREAFAAYGQTMPSPVITLKEEAPGDAAAALSVEIENPALCPRYIGRLVTDVKLIPSPQWLRHRLTMCGVRPINAIVDITNYVMLEYGQPLHAFNCAAVKDARVIVRNARPGETFTTLDGTTRVLDESMLMIADPEKALAIAGVMGGENSMVTEDAGTVLFESANFDKVSIRLTSKKLGLRTDASAKYEKGIDPELAARAVDRAMELVELLGCGKVMPGRADAYSAPRAARVVAYRPACVNALLGTDIGAEDMAATLARVGIATHALAEAGKYEAAIPTFRGDIVGEADIAEEVARFYGYNRIASVTAQTVAASGVRDAKRGREDRAAEVLLGLGYSEALTFPFESQRAFDRLGLPEDDPLRRAIPINNPLNEDFSVMRTVPLDGLLQSLARNASRRHASAYLFERAYTYHADVLPLAGDPRERNMLTLAAYDPAGLDFFALKGDVLALLAALGLGRADFAPLALPYLHPGRGAAFRVGDTPLGYMGELHPQAGERYGITARAYVAVLDMDAIHGLAAAYRPRFAPLAKFPGVQRDLALKVKTEVSAGEIAAAIRERGGPLLKAAELFDVYQGPQLAEGYKSMAYSLLFRAADRTLTDEEAQKPINAILRLLRERHGAELRDR